MYEWLTKITITCFAASYLVTLVLEVSRLFFRVPVRLAVMLAFAVAGLFAHTAHIIVEFKEGADIGLPLARWYDWCLIAAWVLAAIYIVYTFRRPKSVAGLFLLPVVLILIVLAEFFFGPSFPAERVALLRMGQIHGIGLLLGTVTVILGFVAGLMYLAQSFRLKRKLPRREGLKLPSLEWLQRVNRRALSLSSIFIAFGLVAGVILNLINHRVPWTEPLVITSGVLLLWLIVAMLFEYLYKPAREGRKVAYLTIASFVFLGLVLCTVFFNLTTSHGQATPKNSESKSEGLNLSPSKDPLCRDLETARRPVAGHQVWLGLSLRSPRFRSRSHWDFNNIPLATDLSLALATARRTKGCNFHNGLSTTVPFRLLCEVGR